MSKTRIQRVYVKDVSFEAPSLLKTMAKEWKPEVKLDLNNTVNRLDDNVFEVTLVATATVKSNDEMAYLVEVQQAGVFVIESDDDVELRRLVGCNCPNDLFPFVREIISSLVTAGGFPPLLLSPVNFEKLYDDAVSQSNEEAKPH